jgi:hypothetical protein
MAFTIQQALTPKVDALVEAAKEKFRLEFDDEEAEKFAFAPGTHFGLLSQNVDFKICQNVLNYRSSKDRFQNCRH